MKTVILKYREGSSDKVYQTTLEPKGSLFVVNTAYGRRGSTLQTGTKTPIAVDWEQATRIFSKVVNEKRAKGYTEAENGTPYQQTANEPRFTGILPQLLNPIEEDEALALIRDGAWCLQEKIDGRRVIIQKQGKVVTGINRKGLVISLPKSIEASALKITVDFIIDGECVGDVFHAFDLLGLNTEDLTPLRYIKRWDSMVGLLDANRPANIKIVRTAFSTQHKHDVWELLKKEKAEGVVFKRLDAPYTPGRPNNGGTQLKHKFYATLSAVVGKINEQRSVEIVLLYDDGWHTAGNVTIPPNQEVPSVGAVIEIRYLYAFKESGVVYQPTYLNTRTDITQLECRAAQLKYKADDSEA
jgi:bifunctional non-homologous end joining protein LigD